MKSVQQVVFPAIVAVILAGAATVPARAADESAAWAPADSLVYLGLPNVDVLVESVKKTAQYRMLNDPALEEVVQPWKKFESKARELLAKRLGLDSPKQLELRPHGGVMFFLTATPPAKDETEPQPHLGLVLDMGSDAEAAQKLTRVVVEKALEEGGRRETKEISGVEVTTLRFKPAEPTEPAEPEGFGSDGFEEGMFDLSEFDLPDDVRALLEQMPAEDLTKWWVASLLSEMEPPEETAFAWVDTKLVLASDTETAAETARRVKRGKGESLASSPAMKLLGRHCEAKAPVQVLFDVPKLIELATRDNPESAKFTRAMGTDAFGPLVATYEFGPTKEIEGRLRGYLELKGRRIGLAKLLAMENVRVSPPSEVGADAAVFALANLSPAQILSEIFEINSRVDPQWSDQMRANLVVPMPDGTTLDIQKDVVDHLGGPLYGSLMLAQPYDADSVNAIVVLGHKSRTALEKLLALIPPGAALVEEMLGNKILSFPVVPIQGIALGLSDRMLALGTRSAVEQRLRAEGRKGPGLAEDPVYKRLAKHVPRQASVVAYSNEQAMFDAQVAIHQAADLAAEPPFFAPAGMWLRWLLVQQYGLQEVQDPKALRKYLGATLMTVATETDGLRLDTVSIVPKSKKSKG